MAGNLETASSPPRVVLDGRAKLERFVLRGLSALPPAVQARLAGSRRGSGTEQPQPDIALLLRMIKLGGHPDLDLLTPDQAREEIRTGSAIVAPVPTLMESVTDLIIPGPGGEIPGRLFRPMGLSGKPPLLLYFHGGGWVTGSIESHDRACRLLAEGASVAVLSIEYRLAPEHPFPAAVEDAFAAYRWALEAAAGLGLDPTRIAIGGDSAGGNLAAVTTILARDSGGAIPAAQLLIYPVTDLSMRRHSYESFATGYFLTAREMSWYSGHYLARAAEATDPRVSPILTEDLSGLSPTLVFTAAFDPLRDEGEVYAAALTEAGVRVECDRCSGQIHGFLNFTGVSRSAQREVLRIGQRLRRSLDSSNPVEPS